MSEYARVYLLDNPYFLDKSFEYYIPPEQRGRIAAGDFVTVPFGTSNRKKLGLAVELTDQAENNKINHKPIFSVLDKSMSLNSEMLSLCFFIKEQTLCTIGDAVRAMVPASALSRLEAVYLPTELAKSLNKSDTNLDEVTLLVCDFICKKGSVRFDLLKSRFGASAEAAVNALLSKKLIKKDVEVKTANEKTESYCCLSISEARADGILKGNDKDIRLSSAKHIAVLRYLFDNALSEISEKTLCDATEATSAQITALCKKGILERKRLSVDRSVLPVKEEVRELILNDEQRAAFCELQALYESNEPKAALLFGVTGSGKTSVMLKTIDRVLEDGRGVILLLPEISLTPQTLEIFCKRYGERVAIIHSGLSAGERFDTHKRIKNGGADVVIGTRSAVFAPLPHLGLIIIDEEQEHTYKSDMNPKYHARDIARFRCAHNNALMLLCSATPSFESYKKATEGTYSLIKLKHRYGGSNLPRVRIADMRESVEKSSSSPLGTLLCKRLTEVHEKKEQSILFINRRGYNSFVSCRSCGEAIKCPHCSVSMTYHTLKSYDSGELRCHWCGYRAKLPEICPSCASEHLSRMGFGTQRVEQELSELLPSAKILRMDTDTTSTKHSYENMLGCFRRHEADLLLGTQMVTKGHDFPDVTLVGVLLADASLYLDDYRASERTFSMLTQVIGRAGRGNKDGEAIIQTSNPDNECIKLACMQDYETFYKNEIRLRKSLVFPPFCDIVLLTVSSSDEPQLLKASNTLSALLDELLSKDYSDVPMVKYGPFEAPIYKVEGKYRMRTIIKCKLNKRSRELFSNVLSKFSEANIKGLSLSIDFNPSSL